MRAILLGVSSVLFFCSEASPHSIHDIDLAIGDHSSWERPSILIAWRNTFKIFEAEVLVKNLGSDTGRGNVHLEIVNEDGSLLLTKPNSGSEVTVEVPGRDGGGLDGVLVQILGTKEANQLIDRLDRDGVKYSIRAHVETLEGDADPINNISSKTYNSETKIRAGETVTQHFEIKNPSKVDDVFFLTYETNTPAQSDWKVELGTGNRVALRAGETRRIPISVSAAKNLSEPNRFDLRLKVLQERLNAVSDIKEWFLAIDETSPALFDDEEIVETYDGFAHVEVLASDSGSGIKEASGVKLEYSTDDGVTFSNKVMAYLDGNFLNPTRFLGEVGPFLPGTHVNLAVSASDSVGNISRKDLGVIEIKK